MSPTMLQVTSDLNASTLDVPHSRSKIRPRHHARRLPSASHSVSLGSRTPHAFSNPSTRVKIDSEDKDEVFVMQHMQQLTLCESQPNFGCVLDPDIAVHSPRALARTAPHIRPFSPTCRWIRRLSHRGCAGQPHARDPVLY